MTNTTQFNFIVTYLQVQTAKLLSIHMQNTGSQSQWGICIGPSALYKIGQRRWTRKKLMDEGVL